MPRLRSVPCVGPVTAAAFLAAVDDAQRFRHAHHLEAYLGLVPREYRSGETQRRGPITKAGHSRTRWLLIQAAVSILRRHPPEAEALRTWALRIAARRGTQGPSSRSPVASRAFSMRCCVMAACSSPSAFGLLVPRLLLSWPADPLDDAVTMRALLSRRFDGWVSAKCCLAAVAGPPRRWRPHPSNPFMRRRASLAMDEREYKADGTSRDRPTVTGEP